MHWKTLPLLITALILAGFSFLASAEQPRVKGKDQKALQGVWKGSAGDKKAQMTFDGKKFTFMMGDSAASGTFAIDASKSPKQIDLTVTKGSDDHTKKFEGKTSKGIYELDGNKLKWAAYEPGKEERPDAFPKAEDEKKSLYITFERAKQ